MYLAVVCHGEIKLKCALFAPLDPLKHVNTCEHGNDLKLACCTNTLLHYPQYLPYNQAYVHLSLVILCWYISL